MTFIPKKDKKAQNISLVLILIGMAVFALSGFVAYASLFQVLAVAVIVIGVQILVRYALSDYVYIIDDREDGSSDFVVIKRQGKRETKVCHISIFAIEDMYKRGEKSVNSRTRFSYTQNLGADAHVILFRDGDRTTEVLIEADKALISAIRERMDTDGSTSGTAFAM